MRPTGPERENEGRRGGNEGGGPPRRGGDPVTRALDTNDDGKIDKAELRGAAAALRKLDVNNDGQLTSDELRGPGGGNRGDGGGRPRGNRPPGQAGGPRGPQPADGPRQPWILVHANEVDLNKDRVISRDEIIGEATQKFAGYDANQDGKLTQHELSGRDGSRSAMGGFLKGHFNEIDRDGDGILTRREAIGNAERMFGKMDTNQDGEISSQETESSRR